MENKNDPKVRIKDDREGNLEDETSHGSNPGDTVGGKDRSDSRSSDASERGSEDGDARAAGPESEADPFEAIDSTEVSREHRTSALYRRAVSDYDPDELQPQLLEHYVFHDPEFDRDGYF